MFFKLACAALLLLLPLCTSLNAPSKLPCPPDTEISPCVCTVGVDVDMYVDCSQVQDADELKKAFSGNIPFSDFTSLVIENNNELTELRVGDFGQATFKEIHITGGILDTIDEMALSNSYTTLTILELQHNSISSFPFEEIFSFSKLTRFRIDDNDIKIFPEIESSTLQQFNIGYNPLGDITADALKKIPHLVEIGLQSTGLTEIATGTLTGLTSLSEVHLENNTLTILHAGTIEVHGTNFIYLGGNDLTSIEVSAIKGATGELWLENNLLPELVDKVWQPLLDAGVILYASGNPLSCDCSVAWLVLEAKYISDLGDDVACEDGELVKDLDPAIYVKMCG
ncbi:oplophorus-luciferin 2-monooxygenase non-catalytic subunit-like [Homarus americanus]|uniref:Oplophorus-luciferin 2-monooxygenase non-catalytic subunit-like 1 n=1 Tax=Homarus americanus TaxID=6706 RepID=A0A8J5JSR4_HOMAM|nr:oplophorus-luciferin 2-monooxygenase non-catalytic subunit-like [Homarus americanus]KAG7163652.1 Oplophorus-luciferin 2-monooxygenase non-catalytic subunit-like 1 [Homarus americanus]